MFMRENPIFEITEVLKIKRERSRFKTKRRNINVISCRTDGGAEFTFGDRTISVSDGDVLYIPKRTEYSQKTEGETIIAIHIRMYSQTAAEVEFASVKNKDNIISSFNEIYSEWTKKLPGYRQRALGILYRVMGDIKFEQCMSIDNPYSKIINSVTYIKSHFTLPNLTVSDIADKSNISEIYFRKLWRKCCDITPAQYIVKLRINFAKALLSGSEYTVSEIAEQCGFSDSKYFSTVFKRLTGTTPSEYRKK